MGLSRTDVELADYSAKWHEEFLQQKEVLSKIFGDDAVSIEHVGSTSIPGLKAKPIIDIQVAVNDLEVALKHKEELEKEGYEFRGNAGVEGRYFFAKGPQDNRTHYLHVEPYKSSNWETHIYFRDYLIEHPEALEAYQKLKEELAEKYPEDRKSYTAGKNDFIVGILEKARAEYKND
jgi:GrpB-like predicted nucleotidyltransferase (UPF0157 family)